MIDESIKSKESALLAWLNCSFKTFSEDSLLSISNLGNPVLMFSILNEM